MDRKIAVFTGTRADWSRLRIVCDALVERGADVQLIVSGSHLSEAHGMTANEIQFPIAAKVNINVEDDTPIGTINSLRICLDGVAEAIDRLKPDIFVVLGDRYEAFGAAWAAHIMGIPIAHLHAGETTLGATDDYYRSMITALATWKFTSAPAYSAKVYKEMLGHEELSLFNDLHHIVHGKIPTYSDLMAQ